MPVIDIKGLGPRSQVPVEAPDSESISPSISGTVAGSAHPRNIEKETASDQEDMAKADDIYNAPKRINAAVRKINRDIPKPNRDYILKFKDVLAAQGISLMRILKYTWTLGKISALMNHQDFKDANRTDLEALLAKIELSKWAAWTKHDYKVIIKRFWQWLKHRDDGYPKEVRWIRTTIKANNRLLPENLLTEAEVQSLLKATEHPRDTAFIAILFDTGCRPAEILNLRIRNVEFDQYGARIMVSGKTGMRPVRLIRSLPYVSIWLGVHPYREDRESFLWTAIGPKNHNKRLIYDAARHRVLKITEKAEISKRVFHYLFRHTDITEKHFLDNAQANLRYGWCPGSKTRGGYEHLTQKNVDDALLRHYGLKKDEADPEKSQLLPVSCPRCKFSNPPEAKFCAQCSMVLDVKTAVLIETADEVADRVLAKVLEKMKKTA